MSLDPFTILGVKPNATDEEIKNAYRLRMSLVHPDKFPSGSSQWQEANRMAREINEAHNKIKTAEARRAFQASKNPPPRPQPRKTNPPPRQSTPSPHQPEWKSPRQKAEEARESLRKHEEYLEHLRRERASEQAALLEKHPWVREWRKAVRPFQKNKMVTIYGAAFLCLGLVMLIRYPSFRGMELLFWFTHPWFQR